MSDRLDSTLDEVHAEIRGVRGELTRLQALDRAAPAERDALARWTM
jgi:hypothetical protein